MQSRQDRGHVNLRIVKRDESAHAIAELERFALGDGSLDHRYECTRIEDIARPAQRETPDRVARVSLIVREHRLSRSHRRQEIGDEVVHYGIVWDRNEV